MAENSLGNNESAIVLMYTAVVLDSESYMVPDTVLSIAGSSFFSDILVSQVELTAVVLKPVLVVNLTTQVMSKLILVLITFYFSPDFSRDC